MTWPRATVKVHLAGPVISAGIQSCARCGHVLAGPHDLPFPHGAHVEVIRILAIGATTIVDDAPTCTVRES